MIAVMTSAPGRREAVGGRWPPGRWGPSGPLPALGRSKGLLMPAPARECRGTLGMAWRRSRRPGTSSVPLTTDCSSSWARSRRAQYDAPARVTPATIRTSWRSGCSRANSSAEVGSSGMSSSTSGGSTSRSITAAHPDTLSGHAIVCSASSRGWPGGRSSCSIEVNDPSSAGPSMAIAAARAGSCATSVAVSTSA